MAARAGWETLRFNSQSGRALTQRRPWRQPAEATLSRAMAAAGLMRVDFLGAGAGMWSVHPTQRSPGFYTALPELIRRIEAGDVPEDQRGDFDLTPAMLASVITGVVR